MHEKVERRSRKRPKNVSLCVPWKKGSWQNFHSSGNYSFTTNTSQLRSTSIQSCAVTLVAAVLRRVQSWVLNNRRHENKCSEGLAFLHADITQKPPIWSAITLGNQDHLPHRRAIHLAETDHDTSLILSPFTSLSHPHTHSLSAFNHGRPEMGLYFKPPQRCATCLCVSERGPKRGLSLQRPWVMEGSTGPLRLCTKIVLDLGASEETYIHLATGQRATNVRAWARSRVRADLIKG